MILRTAFGVAFAIAVLAGFAADLSAEAPAKPESPPHPGEPAAHRVLNPTGQSTPARIYAREHPDGPPRVEPVYERIGRADQWEITLPKLHPDGKDAVLTLWVRDGDVVCGYTLAPGADNLFHYTSTYRLALGGNRLTGSVRIRFLSRTARSAAECLSDLGTERIAILDVKADGGKLSGTGKLADGASFNLTGVVHAGGRAPKPADTLADGDLWPGHRGASGCGTALDKGHALVADLTTARPVWKCDQDLPDGRSQHSGGGGFLGAIAKGVDWLRHSGAKCGPVVSDGRVFQYTMIPSGPINAKAPGVQKFDAAVREQSAHDWTPGPAQSKAAAPVPGMGTAGLDDKDPILGPAAKTIAPPAKPEDFAQRTEFCVGADDTVYCFDAKTGATLWKTVYPGASANYGGSKGGPQLCPFVWQGKIYVLGSTARLYCLDAKTGQEIWQSSTGWEAACKYNLLQDCLAANEGFPRNRSMEYSLTVADLGGGKGVVVCNDGRGKLHQGDGYPYTAGPGLIGLDALTGKRLWQTQEGIASSATPVRWAHQGKTYILAAAKAVTCIDPATGALLWQVPCSETGMGLAVADDVMLCNVDKTCTAFKITPQKAERIWSLPGKPLPTIHLYPIIYKGHLYSPLQGEDTMSCVRLSDGKILADGVKLGGGHTGGGMFTIAGEGQTFSSGIAVTGIEENTKPVKGSPWRVAFAIGYLTPMDPALADGRLFIRDKTGIVCYDLRDGK